MSRSTQSSRSSSLPFYSNPTLVPDEGDAQAIARARVAREFFGFTDGLPVAEDSDRTWRMLWQDTVHSLVSPSPLCAFCRWTPS
jgi:hypothetical protein